MIIGPFIAAAVLIASGQAAPQTAPQTSPQPLPQTQLDEVVVEGSRLTDRVEAFVDNIVAAPMRRGPARWHRDVCVGVVNLRPETAQVIADRVSAIALQVGLEPGEPGCSPNILIVATEDSEAMARGLAERSPLAFQPAYSGGSRSRQQFEAFLTTPRPVRWWHVSVPVGRETGQIAVRIPGFAPPQIRGVNSRIQTATRNDMLRAFIIVDIHAASGVSAQQLGDYIGMVAMAQIDPEAETGAYDTVLNLFEPGHVVDGLTDWDRSYLEALYSAELNRANPDHQAGEIASTMVRDQRRQQEETPTEP